jgi:DNA-binding CsgD family transcriptional regulator
MRSTRIAVHSWDRLTGDAIASWLDALPGWLVVGTTVTVDDLVLLCRLRPPDVVVCQLEPVELGLARLLSHKLPDLHVIAVCPACREDEARLLREAGVHQVVCVRGGLASLRGALDRAWNGRAPASAPGALTDRELEVLALVCAGLTASQLGDALRLSPHTVVNYKRRIFGKLGVQSRAQAAAEATRLGLVRPPGRASAIRARPEGAPALTHRERDILASIARGESVRQTAHALGIAVKTVEAEQRQLFFKLRVHNRAQALAEALRLGLA